MPDPIDANRRFLRGIYTRAPHTRHAFVCNPLLEPAHIDGLDYAASPRPLADFLPLAVRNYEKRLRFLHEIGDDAVPYVPLITGTYLYAQAFGCPVETSPGQPPFAAPRVASAHEADQLPEPDLQNARALSRVFEFARLIQAELGPQVPLGPPDMQTGFDTACLVWEKADILTAMLAQPDSVRRLAQKAARLLTRFLLEFRRQFPQASPCHCPSVWAPPELPPWVSNDECGAMNTPMFEAFCLPELTDLAHRFGGLAMHCCAAAEHQFPSFRKIPNLYAFNRVPAQKGILPILEHFAGPHAPVHVLSWLPPETIRQLVTRAPRGTRFIFVLPESEPPAAKKWLQQMHNLPNPQ